MSHLNAPEGTELKDLQAIPKWTRRYAQNRTLPFLLFGVIFLALWAAFGGSSYLGAMAFRSGNMPLFSLAMVGLAAGIGFCLWFSNPWWGGKWLERTADRMYSGEGSVALEAHTTDRSKAWFFLAASLFAVSILVTVALGLCGIIPIRYMQPVLALYMVPFLVFLAVWMRPMAGWIPFLWPVLYALHAILVIAGAPIQFENWPSLNMLIPTLGYGLLCGLIGHFYGRYALKRLKKVTGAKE
jgi:hypothetical protein